jgi:hypothetical protein
MRNLKNTAGICLALLILCSAPYAQERPFNVSGTPERVTVRAANALLADVVAEVARVAEIELVGQDKLAGRLSVDFSEHPLEKALGIVLDGVNYSIQKVPGENGAPPRLVLRIASMARGAIAPVGVNGPLHSPALDALVAEIITDHDDQVEVDVDDDPDYYADIQKDRLEASKLAAEGAFGPKADVESLVKLMANYNDEIRLEALKALGTRAMTDQILIALTQALGDDHWGVRNAAVDILGAARDLPSLERVGQLVAEDERAVQIDALRVIAARAQRESMVQLHAYLKKPRKAGDDDALLRAAAQQLIDELEWRAQAAKGERR